MDGFSRSQSLVFCHFAEETRPCGQLQPSALMSHRNQASKTARPMRTNVSRWDPVLLGLVQGRGAAAQKSLGLYDEFWIHQML